MHQRQYRTFINAILMALCLPHVSTHQTFAQAHSSQATNHVQSAKSDESVSSIETYSIEDQNDEIMKAYVQAQSGHDDDDILPGGGRGGHGIMFSMKSNNGYMIDVWNFHILTEMMGMSQIQVYARPGNYTGKEVSSGGWNLMYNYTIVVQGRDEWTDLDWLDVYPFIKPGETKSIFIYSRDIKMIYSLGTSEYAFHTGDGYVDVYEGAGIASKFSGNYSDVYSPRKFAGRIEMTYFNYTELATHSDSPSSMPSSPPSSSPSVIPTSEPSRMPSESPSNVPSSTPSAVPSITSSERPSSTPSHAPSSEPSNGPTLLVRLTAASSANDVGFNKILFYTSFTSIVFSVFAM